MENIKKSKKPTKIEDMTKEQIRQAILKKRECNAKAQRIVESLLEKSISEIYFLQCLADINQSHFEDVIEERSITHLCGYPVCQKTLSERDIPKQKYRISVKTNKVYDITARKSFCSNSCYRAAMYIKKQMLTSPLWFREYEEIPNFQLLPLNTTGCMGQEIDVSLTEKISIKSVKKPFTSVNDFANATLDEISNENTEEDFNKKNAENSNNLESTCKDYENDIKEATEEKTNREFIEQENLTPVTECSKLQEVTTKEDKMVKIEPQKKFVSNSLNIIGEITEKPDRKIDPLLTSIIPNSVTKEESVKLAKKMPQKQSSVTAITIEVEKCLAEWFTLDTILFLFGEKRVKEMVTDKGECIKEHLNNYAKSIFYNSNTYDQYQAICRKLNMLELEDKRLDAQALQRETKPLPDYSMLQEESKKLQLKVRAFFAGETVFPEVENDAKPSSSNEDEKSKITQLPLVDKNAQNALRRRIVCQHLNKMLPDLLQSLGLLTLTISSDVRLLVNTFKLKANNIMFKPIQWTLIAIVIIKLLSIRDRRLEYLLEQPTTYQHMQLLLLSYKQDGGYLDRLLSWLTDIDRLLDPNDTQLTIE